MSRTELLRRIAAIEAALKPKPRFCWSLWHRLLTEAEYDLVEVLSRRGATFGGDPSDSRTWHDDPEGWAALCENERERALLASVLAKAEEPIRSGKAEPLYCHFLDLGA